MREKNDSNSIVQMYLLIKLFYIRLGIYLSTCSVVTLRSSSDIYCSFLTRDLWADCLFAKILTLQTKIIMNIKYNEEIKIYKYMRKCFVI